MGHRLTQGHVLRHVPPSSTIGFDVALLDIAQDFLLAHLHEAGLFDLVVFKGGTALRKLFAGAAGRFSTDIDLALASVTEDRAAVGDLVAEAIDGQELGTFRFSVENRRGRWQINVGSDFGDVPMPLKLDIGPPCWLEPEVRAFVATPVQDRYDFTLPPLPTMQLPENLAEKIARLNRVSAARDASDLVWAATTPPFSGIDRDLLRRLAVLKMWVDAHGLDGHWLTVGTPGGFDSSIWLRTGREWDDESIGLLTHPPPPIEVLEASLVDLWSFLSDLDVDEKVVAVGDARDRAKVIDLIENLPGSALGGVNLWLPAT